MLLPVVMLLAAGQDSAPAKGCQFGHFDDRNLPKPCWRPFSAESPFNRRLPKAPRLVSDSESIAQRTASFGPGPRFEGGDAGTADDYNHPIYFSSKRDPVYRVKCLEYGGDCEVNGHRVRIPRRARAAGGGDGHLGVISQSRKWEYDFWQVRERSPGGGVLQVGYGGRTKIGKARAHGLGSNATAAHFATSAGAIRPEELRSGEIDHALFMVVKCTNGRYVFPARGPGAGRECSEVGLSGHDAPALGQHFFLGMSNRQIEALDAPRWQSTILRAMSRYGLFVGDTGGSGWGLMLWSGLSYPAGTSDPWIRLGRRLRLPAYTADDGTTRFIFDLTTIVPWGQSLRVAAPCVSRRSC